MPRTEKPNGLQSVGCDRLRPQLLFLGFKENTYTWNANLGNPVADFGIVSSLGEDQGFTTFTLVAPNGGTVKGWVLSPAHANVALVPGERLSIEKTGAAEEFFIVMSVEPETTPPLEVLDHGLAGTVVRLGDKTVALDRASGTLLRGAAAEGLELDHTVPLPVRGLTARVTSFDAVELRWLPTETGADSIVIERRGPGETEFSPVATISADTRGYTAAGLAPESTYTWRLVPVANGIAGTASDLVSATTWEDGVRLYVEDFAPRIGGELPAVNAIGHWEVVNQDRGWALRATEGSLRNAHHPIGEMATTGRTRINFQNVFYTEGFSADLSTSSAAVEIDIQTEGTIRFSLLLKLADGRWVRTTSEAHIASRFSWHRQRWSIPSITAWQEYNIGNLSTGAGIVLTPADLMDIRGIGIRAQWPLNERWARADQLHLYAKDFVRLGDDPAESWRLEWFGTTENAGDAADHYDFDKDGVPNRLERAFGGNPREPSRAVLPALGTVEKDGETYTVVQSSDLDDTWSAASIVVLDVVNDTPAPGFATVTVRPDVPMSAGVKQFLALRVTESP